MLDDEVQEIAQHVRAWLHARSEPLGEEPRERPLKGVAVDDLVSGREVDERVA